MKPAKEITFIFETSGGRKKGRKSNASSINRHIARASHARRRRGTSSSSSHIPAPLASSLNRHAAATTANEEDEESLLPLLSPRKQPTVLVARVEEPPVTPVQIVRAPKCADSSARPESPAQQQRQILYREHETCMPEQDHEEEKPVQKVVNPTSPAASPEAESSPRVVENTTTTTATTTSSSNSNIRALDVLKHMLQTSTTAARARILTSGSAYAAASSLHIYHDRRMEGVEYERATPIVLGGSYGVYQVKNLVHAAEPMQGSEHDQEELGC